MRHINDASALTVLDAVLTQVGYTESEVQRILSEFGEQILDAARPLQGKAPFQEPASAAHCSQKTRRTSSTSAEFL